MLPTLFTESSHNFTDSLGMVFLHSIWQFTLIWVLLSVILKKNVVRSSAARYAVSLISMLLMVFVALVTFVWYFDFENESEILHSDGLVIFSQRISENPLGIQDSLTIWFEPYQIWVITFWITGILILSGKLLFSLWYLQQLKKTAYIPAKEHMIIQSWSRLSRKLGIRKKINIGFSHDIRTPLIVGQLRPFILFPFSVVNQLSEKEVEFILLHELAHYARSDYWANLLLSFVEILFYYHPAVYMISGHVKQERENCCDEFAIHTIGGQAVDYAKTLIRLQEFESGNSPELSLAFSGKNKIFMDRIKKILNMNQQKNVKSENVFLSLLIVVALFFATRETLAKSFFPNQVTDYLSFVFPEGFARPEMQSDTMPKTKESVTIIQKNDDKEVRLQMENGEIRKLEIDGKEIPAEEYDKYSDVTKNARIKTFPKRSGSRPEIFMFDFNQDGMRLKGDMDIKWDSILGDFSWDDIENFQFDGEDFQKNMQRMQEKMQEFNFRFIKPDSMMSFDFPKRRMEIFRYPDGDGEDFQQHFEFSFPDRPGFEKEFEFDRKGGFGSSENINDVLGNQLNADGLLIPGKENKVELSGKNLKINGEKQPSNIWHKYKRIFEDETGNVMEKNSRISFHFWGREAKRRYRAF